MWEDPVCPLKSWKWSVSSSSSSESLEWSPASTYLSSSPSSSTSSPFLEEGRMFTFDDLDIEAPPPPQGMQNLISGQEFWDIFEHHKAEEHASFFYQNAPKQQLPPVATILPQKCFVERESERQNETAKISIAQSSCCSDSETDDTHSFASKDETEQVSLIAEDFKCRWIDCKAVFSNQSSLVHHIDRHHVEGRKEDFRCFWHGCSRKNRSFNARYKLLIHMRVHTHWKPNQCHVEGCGKAFSRLENLKIHMRSHTGERPYVCSFARCAKAFSNSSDRAKHQRTHIESKPYHCLFFGCLKKYTDPSSLRKHAKTHYPLDSDESCISKAHLSSVKSKYSRSLKRKNSLFDKNYDFYTTTCENLKFELLDDTEFDFEFEMKQVENDILLSDVNWMANGELKDIEQILGF